MRNPRQISGVRIALAERVTVPVLPVDTAHGSGEGRQLPHVEGRDRQNQLIPKSRPHIGPGRGLSIWALHRLAGVA